GARAEPPLHRGARLLASRAPARDARRAQVLPPRDDRALPRARVAVVVRQGGAAQPALLAPLEPARLEARVVKRLALLIGAVASAPARSGRRELRDANFANRFGRKEVVLSARDGASATASSVPSARVSHELAAYPKALLSSPLEVTTPTATIEPGHGPGEAP